MPWSSDKQVRYLLSSGSPLTEAQKKNMKQELHRDPSLIKHKESPKPTNRYRPPKEDN